MTIIVITGIILFGVMILWSYHNLAEIDKPKKFLYIFLEIIFVYIMTYIIFKISKNNIVYPNEEILKAIQNTLIFMFAGINGCILMPFISKTIGKLDGKDIESNELIIKLVILLVIIFLIFIFESNYMSSTQDGILKYLNSLKK